MFCCFVVLSHFWKFKSDKIGSNWIKLITWFKSDKIGSNWIKSHQVFQRKIRTEIKFRFWKKSLKSSGILPLKLRQTLETNLQSYMKGSNGNLQYFVPYKLWFMLLFKKNRILAVHTFDFAGFRLPATFNFVLLTIKDCSHNFADHKLTQ